MTRYPTRRYNLHVLLLMAVYIAVLFLVWPRVQDAGQEWLKIVLAISPAIPITAAVALMVRRVLASDELQQRTHLIALGVATAAVGTLSLIGGFLAMAKVWVTDGSVLFWVFPSLCFVYGLTRPLVNRCYTGSWDFWSC